MDLILPSSPGQAVEGGLRQIEDFRQRDANKPRRGRDYGIYGGGTRRRHGPSVICERIEGCLGKPIERK